MNEKNATPEAPAADAPSAPPTPPPAPSAPPSAATAQELKAAAVAALPKVGIFDRAIYTDDQLVDHPAWITKIEQKGPSGLLASLCVMGVNRGDPGAETVTEVPWTPGEEPNPNRWRLFTKTK